MDHQKTGVFSTAYLPPVEYYAALLKQEKIFIEQHEHFLKQTYRNRCYIYGTNGKLALTVPLEKRGERTPVKDIRICYTYHWQKIHWRSIESAYRCSPFFEFYEDDFAKIYQSGKHTFLIDLNEELFYTINKLLKIKPIVEKTSTYERSYAEMIDYRGIAPKKDNNYLSKSYKQVFDDKYGFIPNLSIVDLLFNQGPRALDYI